CGPSSAVRSFWLSHGIPLMASLLRRLRICSRVSLLSVARAESRVASTCFCCCAAPLPVAISSNATTAKTPRNTRMIIIPIAVDPPFLLAIDRCFFLKECGRQNDAGNPQAFEELGANAARLKYTDYFAVRTDAFLVKCKDLL